ncbi:MAG: P1 family peptidase [Theionarchaea archaeon]|nr:P1 family peptidase [Theionarchaea archaeon]
MSSLNLRIGSCRKGDSNTIADVKGVSVGHCTLIQGEGPLIPGKGPVRTGVTAIIPHPGNIYQEKVLANCHVINGYCKPIGLIQVRELGVLETPLVLTNTLSVGTAADALIQYKLDRNPGIGVTTGSVNPLVLECNYSYLNDIRGRHVRTEHVMTALANANHDFEQGAVGAGTGMSAFEFKGGIGSSSRVAAVRDDTYTVGVLVLTNFGRREDLIINGVPVGKELAGWPGTDSMTEGEKGSIIMIVATDCHVTSRQLGRVARRAGIGLARTGGTSYHGSGDVVLAFSTAQKVAYDSDSLCELKAVPDHLLNQVFRATVEATEEAIVNSLLYAGTTVGRDNRVRYQIPEQELETILRGW